MIVHLIDNLFPESGGPTTVVLEFARYQAMHGRQVAVVARKAGRNEEARERLARHWSGTGVRFIDLSEQSAPTLEQAIDSMRVEVLHVHCVWEPLVRTGCRLARRRSIPYVLSTHGMLHPFALQQKWLKKSVYMRVFPWILRSANELFALNREEATYAGQRFRRPCSVLPNGINVNDYAKVDAAPFFEAFPELEGHPYILFVGRLHPIKGIDKLIRSYALCKRQGLPHRLAIVGPEECFLKEAQSTAREVGVAEHVHFLGGIFGPLKLSAYAGCSIFAHRPRFEGFGITVVEALASAKPVVTTCECKLDGAAGANAMLVADDTDEAFAEGLLQCWRRPDEARQMGERGQAWVKETLDWEALARQADRSYAAARTSRGTT